MLDRERIQLVTRGIRRHYPDAQRHRLARPKDGPQHESDTGRIRRKNGQSSLTYVLGKRIRRNRPGRKRRLYRDMH